MNNFINVLQLIVAISVYYVWIFRFDNIIKEFKLFGLSDLTRSAVGTAKISLATLLIVGVWFPVLVTFASLLMGFFMLSAQFFHFKNKSLFIKRLPSLIFLVSCLLIASASLKII